MVTRKEDFEKTHKYIESTSKVSRLILIFNNSSPLLKNRGMNILKQVFGYEVDIFLNISIFQFPYIPAIFNLGGNIFSF